MIRELRTIPVAGLVVLAAFAAGYLLPDLVGGPSSRVPPATIVPSPASTVRPAVTPTAPLQPATPTRGAPTPVATAASSPTSTSGPPTPTRTIATPSPSPSPPASPSPTKRIHVVQSGDTLWDLAQRYGVSVEAIVEANRLATPESLEVGQKLIIPLAQPQSE